MNVKANSTTSKNSDVKVNKNGAAASNAKKNKTHAEVREIEEVDDDTDMGTAEDIVETEEEQD